MKRRDALFGAFVLFATGMMSTTPLWAADQSDEASKASAPHEMRLSHDKVVEISFAAARAGRSDVLEGLIAHGVDPNLRDSKGDTPLILATYYNHLDTVNMLISHGAEPCGKDKKGNTALMGAAFKGESEIVRRLSQAGCPVNTQNDVHQTALMMASLFGRTDTVKTLLELGADPTLEDSSGATAISLAEAQGNSAMVDLLEDATKKYKASHH
ncbi:hypothetical protein GS501_08440 [Saccharibacter sp. 17.LH.SD]|uniref:ankyrin repeat domain-containing protein n=1 Tax=Saccharibacter sp. 17.LH.SD TaxID=2689393 RepID=UPI00136ACE56|nr:ankyrin repeat domain-containing protein [Saccharibacter sp. 17.LH.SD]MXV45066.1 hypothetical protein [Saccharibacter sp. 17.LH.SD]